MIAAIALALPACTERSVQVDLDGGIRINDIKAGVGLEAKEGSGVAVRYRVKREDGVVIADTYADKKTHKFTIGDRTVISGLDRAVIGMKPGGIRHASIPPYSHYGLDGYGDGVVPKGEPLLLEIEMVNVRTSW